MIKGIAPMRFHLEFTGTDEELIDIAEDMSGGLDSHDLGDAMGFFLTHAMMNDSEFSYPSKNEGTELRGWIEYDLFEWEIDE